MFTSSQQLLIIPSRSLFTLGLDGRDDVVRLQVDLEPVSWLVSGLLARTPRASVPLHAHSARNNQINNKKSRQKRKKLLAL